MVLLYFRQVPPGGAPPSGPPAKGAPPLWSPRKGLASLDPVLGKYAAYRQLAAFCQNQASGAGSAVKAKKLRNPSGSCIIRRYCKKSASRFRPRRSTATPGFRPGFLSAAAPDFRLGRSAALFRVWFNVFVRRRFRGFGGGLFLYFLLQLTAGVGGSPSAAAAALPRKGVVRQNPFNQPRHKNQGGQTKDGLQSFRHGRLLCDPGLLPTRFFANSAA